MIEVRQWGPGCYAAYVFDGDPQGSYVGSEMTRTLAREFGEKALRDRAAGLRNAGVQQESPSNLPLNSRSAPVGFGDARRERVNAQPPDLTSPDPTSPDRSLPAVTLTACPHVPARSNRVSRRGV